MINWVKYIVTSARKHSLAKIVSVSQIMGKIYSFDTGHLIKTVPCLLPKCFLCSGFGRVVDSISFIKGKSLPWVKCPFCIEGKLPKLVDRTFRIVPGGKSTEALSLPPPREISIAEIVCNAYRNSLLVPPSKNIPKITTD